MNRREDTKGKRKQVELLAPAGSVEAMEAAFAHGADAVYMGGPRFGARAYAHNPEPEGVVRALDYAHERGKKLYLTVNTLLKQGELKELYDYLLPFYEAGLDAVLVQDLGVLRQIRRDFPDLPVHASTQMTVMDPDGARALYRLGVARVVAARELTVQEMKAIADTGMELEVFVHGAICYCYSGQCLLSSLIGGRSGNRGRCAQPCRLPYSIPEAGRGEKGQEKYLLNIKDMDTLMCLPQLAEAGAVSFKIEGRMKSPRYTGGVTAIYRKYLDLYLSGGEYRVEEEDRRYLRELFDRGGHTEYASRGLHDGMVAAEGKPAFRAPDEAFCQERESRFPRESLKEKIKGKVRFSVGEPVIITVETADGHWVTESGETVQPAKNRPVGEEELRQRFGRLGDTPFVWERLEIEVAGDGFLPVGQLNELRRLALERLIQKKRQSFHRKAPERTAAPALSHKEKSGAKSTGKLYAAVDSMAQLKEVAADSRISRIYLNLSTFSQEEEEEAFRILEECRRSKGAGAPSLYLNLPPVLRLSMKEKLEERLDYYQEAGADGWLVHTWDQAAWLSKRRRGASLQADASLYTFNREAEETLRELGVAGMTLPVELNSRELTRRMESAALPAELIVYGYLPVMVSAQCVRRTLSGCTGRPEILHIRDRKRKRFAVRNCCRYCFNVIYNSAPLFLMDQMKEWEAGRPEALRLQFTIENEREVRRILDSLKEPGTEEAVTNPLTEFTRGHFRRGVE